MGEWPKELLELFEDPILDDVRPKAQPLTPNDRVLQRFMEVTAWVEENGRVPQKDGADIKEKMMYRALEAVRKKDRECIKSFDRLNIL